MAVMQIRCSRLPHGEDLELPAYQTVGSAGMDLRAAIPADLPMVLPPGGRAAIPTGLRIAVPEGFEGQVRSRSGMALRSGVTALNSPGTVDSDYRGEVMVILANLGQLDVVVRRGDRIAQLVFAPVLRARWREVADLEDTGRAEGGFGSTGAD